VSHVLLFKCCDAYSCLPREVSPRPVETEAPKKRRKTDHSTARSSLIAWTDFVAKVEEFEVQHVHASGKFAFGFVEGPLIKAICGGHWCVPLHPAEISV